MSYFYKSWTSEYQSQYTWKLENKYRKPQDILEKQLDELKQYQNESKNKLSLLEKQLRGTTNKNDKANIIKTKPVLNFLSHILPFNHIEIKNYDVVEKKLNKIIGEGKENVHIISDFDMTITKYWHNGERSPNSHDIFTKSSMVNDEFRKRYEGSKAKYYPIEISPDLTNEEKYPYMVEWWENTNETIIEQQIHKDDLPKMVQETPFVYRPVIKDVFYTCREKKIPFLVFSAGIHNIIHEALKQANLYFENMNIVSNKMLFNDQTGICDRFEGPLFHVFNKGSFDLKGTEYGKLVKDRRNVIICGDSLSDLQMADGVKYETCLSVGFLNLNKDKMLERYKENFDIVITDDDSWDLVNELLKILI